MTTLDEARRELYYATNRILIIESDKARPPDEAERRYLAEVTPYREKLRRLDERYSTAPEMILEYSRRIKRLERKWRIADSTLKVEKMQRLINKINKLRNAKKASRVTVNKLRLGNQRARDILYLIEGYQLEIQNLQRLLAHDGHEYHKQRAKILSFIEACDKNWDRYCGHVINYETLLDELWARVNHLTAVVRDMRSNQTVQKANSFVAQWNALISGLTPTELEYLSKSMGAQSDE